jgi:lantibiotic biosynthesis protein
VTADRTHFLDAAARIGRRLCRDAVWADGQCNWLGWAMEARAGQWVTACRAMGSIVYDGTAGIGLFLARLAPLTGDPIIRTRHWRRL